MEKPVGYHHKDDSLVGVIVKIDIIPSEDYYDSCTNFICHVMWDDVEGIYKYNNEDIQPVTGPCFINEYLRHRLFGGREEGGWYYNQDEFVRSVFIADPVQAEAIYEKMEAEAEEANKERPRLSSVLSNGIFVVKLEYAHGEAIAESFVRPHYC
jgi:hypothetical protein